MFCFNRSPGLLLDSRLGAEQRAFLELLKIVISLVDNPNFVSHESRATFNELIASILRTPFTIRYLTVAQLAQYSHRLNWHDKELFAQFFAMPQGSDRITGETDQIIRERWVAALSLDGKAFFELIKSLVPMLEVRTFTAVREVKLDLSTHPWNQWMDTLIIPAPFNPESLVKTAVRWPNTLSSPNKELFAEFSTIARAIASILLPTESATETTALISVQARVLQQPSFLSSAVLGEETHRASILQMLAAHPDYEQLKSQNRGVWSRLLNNPKDMAKMVALTAELPPEALQIRLQPLTPDEAKKMKVILQLFAALLRAGLPRWKNMFYWLMSAIIIFAMLVSWATIFVNNFDDIQGTQYNLNITKSTESEIIKTWPLATLLTRDCGDDMSLQEYQQQDCGISEQFIWTVIGAGLSFLGLGGIYKYRNRKTKKFVVPRVQTL